MSLHCRKMSEQEYIAALRALRETATQNGRSDPNAVDEQEQELTVTYVLGPELDEDTRRKLRAIYHDFRMQRDQVIGDFSRHRLSGPHFSERLTALTRRTVDAYSQVLSPSQLRDLFGVASGNEASLPIDMLQLHR